MSETERDGELERLRERIAALEGQVAELAVFLKLNETSRWRAASPAPPATPASLVHLQDRGTAPPTDPRGVPMPLQSKTELLRAITSPPLAPPLAPLVAPPPAPVESAADDVWESADAGGHALRPETIHRLTEWPPPAGHGSAINIERFLGAKLFAWVGAIVVMIGVGTLGKLAYDKGWLAQVSPIARLAAAYLLSLGFVGVGVWVARRIGRLASVGLIAAGVGSLYITTIIGYKPLGVFSPVVALLVATGIALLGGFFTLHSRMLAVGVVSILGGYVAPAFLGTLVHRGMAPPIHMTVLLAIGLALSWRAPEQFRPLRFVTVAFHLVAAFVWFVAVGHETATHAIVFGAAWWGVTVGESLLAAMRGQTPRANVITPMIATAAFASMGAFALDSPNPAGELFSYVPFALALLSAVIAFQFCGGIAALRPQQEGMLAFGDAHTPEERSVAEALWMFGVTMWLQFGVLLVAGLGIFLDRGNLGIAWLAIALGALEIARRLASKGAGVFGLVVGILGTIWVIVSSGLAARTFVPDPWGIALSTAPLSAAIAVVLCAIAAHRWDVRSRGEFEHDPLRVVAPFAAIGAIATWTMTLALSAGWLMGLTLALAPSLWLALGFRHDRTRWHATFAIGIVGLVSFAWFAIRLMTTFSATRFVLPIAVIGAAAFVLWILASRVKPKLRQHLVGGGIALFSIAMAFDVLADPRVVRDDTFGRSSANQAVLALAIGGLVAIGLGRAWRWSNVVAAGSPLIGLAALMWLGYCTLLPRLAHGPFIEPLLLNMTMGAGVVVLVASALGARWALTADAQKDGSPLRHWVVTLTVCALLSVLWLGSLAVDEIVTASATSVDATARQAGLSLWWGVYSLALIVAGFVKRIPPLRYAGLAGLAVVALKVIIVDLASSGTIWRVIAMLAAGLALVATSVVYVRVGRLLDAETSPTPPS